MKAHVVTENALPAERLHERVKNLDRWWYCVDELLWLTNASAVEVKQATEGRFSLAASLSLSPGVGGAAREGASVEAAISMSRDRLWPPFDWSFKAYGSDGVLTFSNVGFPFLWHSIQLEGIGGSRTETFYGQGETTFEHQLHNFVASVRGSGEKSA
eukprot:CAMPEP_0178458920 /NCGR_PEP_ID=MMETSP0689_2-20121128/47817_1 /TAXON_ID=160604 /ORGANISM="Amphidinium massartii, Strain CS-259" /LENGTH=156 /DNA_ID=CAMNT_0020085289 /DNA_START=57 /DNA_END=524 /DNA_ORIENTATION=-